jgi:hypothetical protein
MSDPQIIIDNLFTKLEQAKISRKSGEIEQATHALRVQINMKKQAKIPLTPREKSILGPQGPSKSCAAQAESGLGWLKG